MPTIVPRVRTPISPAALPEVVSGGFAAIGRSLTATQRVNVAVLVAVETSSGASCYGWNLGNVTASERYEGSAWRPPWFDPGEAAGDPRLERLHALMSAGKAPAAFRAYGSQAEGAADFARVLVRDFPEVLEAASSPDADGFRRALAQRYSTDYASGAAIVDTIQRLQRRYGLVGSASTSGGLALLLFLLWAARRR